MSAVEEWARLADTWEQIKTALAKRISPGAYQNWISRTTLAGFHDGELTIRVPDETTETWIRQEYAAHIRAAADELSVPVRRILYTIGDPSSAAAAVAFAAPAVRTNGEHNGGIRNRIVVEPVFEASSSWLNPRLTFDSYVVGSSNQLAHAAARAVATMPSRSYNPLFIYGGVGIGKTHLIHAIGSYLLQHSPGLNVVYTSTERFVNEMVNSIKLDRMSLFQRHYRSADVLLIDDIHVLTGKERTQEEFFHTFNELYDHRKQIVITSDSAPAQLPGLVERLRSRFEWGLIVDIQPPDLETKMAILDKKAESEGISLPEDVRIYLATKSKSNVRELEGALVRLMAVASVTGQAISLPMAHQTLRHLSNGQEKRISVDAIIKGVSDRFELTPAQLKQKSNTRQIAYPRQIAMYLVEGADAGLAARDRALLRWKTPHDGAPFSTEDRGLAAA